MGSSSATKPAAAPTSSPSVVHAPEPVATTPAPAATTPAPVVAAPAATTTAAPKPAATPAPAATYQGPTLQNNKWIIENAQNQTNIVIEPEFKQIVYLYKCKNTMVTVKGKCNSVQMDNCEKSGVVFDTAIATLEFVNCKSCKAQVNETVPSIQVDSTQGATIYLPQSSLDVEVYSSKSTEINLNVKVDDDYVETAVPSQFLTKKTSDDKWTTEAVVHVGV
eukprot:c9849_g1_i1.p1 GENE.c9849_g1_i1~~c9849_g1_i1.p1  ORF type:complete len:221 (+),score=21.46 c9849_g1_i1:3-665(+)